MEKKYDNNLKLSLWENVSDNANAPTMKGSVLIDGKMYNVALWENERTSETQPIMKGSLELREKK